MSEDNDLISIVHNRVAKEAIRQFPFIGDIVVGLMEDFEKKESREKTVRNYTILTEQLRDIASSLEFLTHETHDFLDRLSDRLNPAENQNKSGEPSGIFQSKTNLEDHALTEGAIANIEKNGETIIVHVKDIELGKLFFPLNMIWKKYRLFLDDFTRMPLLSLLQPNRINGRNNWLCVISDQNKFVVSSFPKPICPQSSGTQSIKQFDQITMKDSKKPFLFEYWPRGCGGTEFLVETKKISDNIVQLKFKESNQRGKDSAILDLRLTFV